LAEPHKPWPLTSKRRIASLAVHKTLTIVPAAMAFKQSSVPLPHDDAYKRGCRLNDRWWMMGYLILIKLRINNGMVAYTNIKVHYICIFL